MTDRVFRLAVLALLAVIAIRLDALGWIWQRASTVLHSASMGNVTRAQEEPAAASGARGGGVWGADEKATLRAVPLYRPPER